MWSGGSNETVVAATTMVVEEALVEAGEPMPIPAVSVENILNENQRVKNMISDGVKDIKAALQTLALSNSTIAANQEIQKGQIETLISDSASQNEKLAQILATLNNN